MTYRAPVRDLTFCLTHAAGLDRLLALPVFADCDADLIGAVLEAAAKLSEDVLAPLNWSGDRHGAKLVDGAVVTAPGFADALKQFADGGWNGLGADPEYGGQGLPKAIEQAAFEMVHAANMAFGLCPMLSQGAIEALHQHGTPEQKAKYLPKLISGEWTGTMNLTEPQSGSDLSTLTARAEPVGDGTYKLWGQKIYITWGDHDATDNILHFVLARLPDAPAGTKGISLFLVSKHNLDADLKPLDRNAVGPVGLEHKLGIHASPTCVMQYDGAVGEMVGQPNQGLAAMFVMMNAARLAVGVEGVALAERAYQKALAYALDRRQGRSVLTGEASTPIFDHPDVRRMLVGARARLQAARTICLTCAVEADLARHAADPAQQARAKRREDFLVPIAKAWATDIGVSVASTGLQVHGGMGFIEETGAAQFYRDARIAPIYEGTNGIQAADLVGRKLSQDNGQAARDLIHDIHETTTALVLSGDERLVEASEYLTHAIRGFTAATDWLLERKAEGANADVAAAAYAYLELCGTVIGGWGLAKLALAARALLDQGDSDCERLEAQIRLFSVFADQDLSVAEASLARITAGNRDLGVFTARALGAEG